LLDRNHGRLRPVANFELCDDMADVIANSEVADLNGAADLLISQSLCDHFQNLKLTRAETRLKFPLGNSVLNPLREVAVP